MADTSRMSGFLPTIKCSMCAQEIEISMMGEHVCGGPAEPTPPLEPSNGYSTYSPYDKPLPPPENSGAQNKSTRLPPPRVDTRAANRPFTRPDQLTPVSASSESRSASPMTPSDGLRSPYPRALGSAARTQINDHQSPDFLAANSDGSFPPFPPPKSPGERYLARPQQYAEADPRYAPVSPRLGQGGLLTRMNTIAPGPFDIKGRRGQHEGADEGRDEEPNHARSKSTDRRAHGRSTSSGSSMSSRSPPSSDIPPIPIRTERPGGYGGFGPPPSSSLDAPPPLTPANRSNTFPKAAPGGSNFVGLPRRPSESARPRHPSTSTVASTTFDGPTFVRTSPPRDPHARHPSITPPPPPRGPPLARKDSAAGINLDAEFGAQNPFHTPSVSQSSNDSSHSPHSKASSRSSPPSSVEPPRRREEKSAIGGFDGLMQDLEQAIAEVPTPQPQQPAVQDARGRRNLDPSLLSPDFADRAIQSGLRSPGLPRDHSSEGRYDPHQGHPPGRPSAPRLEQPNPSLRRPSQPHSPAFPPAARRPSTAAGDMDPHAGAPARRPSTAKGACKACQLPITGKSLSSSDGRLTGHYHKACFACTTCRAPFATASFYVLRDAPYCQRDYHRLNGSCCGGCGGGIEGQCLETARGGGMGGRKFHPGCLVCSDCRGPVSEGYFEIAGRVYCERDAMRRAQMKARGRGGRGRGGPGGMLGVGGGMGRMERRTTRLMMI